MSTSLSFDILARDRASDKFDKVGNSAEKSSGKLKKFAAVGAASFAAAGAAAVVGGKYIFDHGAKLEQMDMKASTVFGNQRSKVDAWSKKNAAAMGLSSREATGLAANFADLMIPMGFARNEAAKMATKVVGLSGALSQWSGGTKSAAEVTEILNAAMLGETDGLKALGISISAAEIEAELLRKGQDKLTGSAKAQATALATQSLILAKSTDAQKAFADGGSPLLSAQAKLTGMFKNTRDELVMKLVPGMAKAATWASEHVAPAMKKAGDWVKTDLIPPIKDFAEKAAPKARDIMEALKGAFQDSKPFIELVGKIITNVVVPGLKKLLDVVGPVMNASIRGLGKALEFVGKAGTWMWNNALQPAFKFLANGIGVVLDGFEAMLGAMGKVPGFGWAKDAAVAMGKAADKAYAVADGLKKIPPKKTVYVSVKYVYSGLRNGTGSTRGGDPNDPGSYLPRMAVTAKSIAQSYMETIADGMAAGGKKIDKVLGASRDRIKTAMSQIRGDMKSMAESIASALNPTDFGSGLAELMASLTGNNGALSGLMAVFDKLKGSVSKGFLSSLMGSGNATLATQLANDPAAAAQASALYDANASMAQSLGDQTAQEVLGDRLERALEKELGKVRDELKELSGKTAKKLRDEIKDLRLEVTGLSPGQRAHLRGAH